MGQANEQEQRVLGAISTLLEFYGKTELHRYYHACAECDVDLTHGFLGLLGETMCIFRDSTADEPVMYEAVAAFGDSCGRNDLLIKYAECTCRGCAG